MSLMNAAQLVCDSVLANRVALNAHNELYHFLMVVNAYGLKAVVDESTNLLMERGYPYLKAAEMSISRATHMLEIANGQKTYQDVRERLRNPGNNEVGSHTSNLDYDF
ncbi:hypothetical protein J3Z65_005103 [Escherichia coli]|nr:hypothetical protein [Escherichia coli]